MVVEVGIPPKQYQLPTPLPLTKFQVLLVMSMIRSGHLTGLQWHDGSNERKNKTVNMYSRHSEVLEPRGVIQCGSSYMLY